METKLNIIIGQGLGPLQFGATEEDIKELFGEPDETENDNEAHTITMFYDNIMTDFVLEQDEDDNTYSLTSILTSNPDYSIDNKIQFGDTEEALIKYAKTLKAEKPETETDTETSEKVCSLIGFLSTIATNHTTTEIITDKVMRNLLL